MPLTLMQQSDRLQEDLELLQQVRNRNREACAKLYDRYSSLIYSLTLRILASPEKAETVLLKSFNDIIDHTPGATEAHDAVVSRLLGSARKASLAKLSSKGKGKKNLDDAAGASPIPDNDGSSDIHDWQEAGHAVASVLKKLTPGTRQVLELSYFNGLSQAEIARALKIPATTVKSRMRLGIQKLRPLATGKQSKAKTGTDQALVLPYVLGELTAAQKAKVEKKRTVLAEEIAIIRHSFELLALTVPFKQPSPLVREELLSAYAPAEEVPTRSEQHQPVSSATPATQKSSKQPWLVYAIVIGIVIAGLGFGLLSQIKSLRGLLSDSETLFNEKLATVSKMEAELKNKDALLSVLASPTLNTVTLNGLREYSRSFGRVIWDPATKSALFQAVNLPATGSDHEYQLWIIKQKKPFPAATFNVIAGNEEQLVLRHLDFSIGNEKEADALSVTLEPKGGSPQPTGVLIMVGSSQILQ